MINKKEITKTITREETVSVVCDVCKKEYFYDDKENVNDVFETQEFTFIHMTCGYGSVFGDGDRIELDICQHCLKEKLGKYIRTIEEYY